MPPIAMLALLLLAVNAAPGDAQQRPSGVRANSGSAFALEALGGSLGSLAGMAIVVFATECGVEDLGCGIQRALGAGAVGAVGAAIGTVLVARATESSRSGAGAVVGAVVGTGIGLGVHWLLNQQSDRNIGDLVTVPIFMLSQGVFAALGSRIGGRRGVK